MIRPFWFDPNLAKLGEWLNDEGFRANIPALRAIYQHACEQTKKCGWQCTQSRDKASLRRRMRDGQHQQWKGEF
jgi:hypothetical protein